MLAIPKNIAIFAASYIYTGRDTASIQGQRLFYAPFPTTYIGTVPPRRALMRRLLRVSVRQRDRLYLLSFNGRTNKYICMSYTETICAQAKHSTLQSTPAGAKSAASARNLTNSMDDPAARAFILFLQETFPDIQKIRFRKHGGKGYQYYILRVKTPRRTFTTKGYSMKNVTRNFLASFNYNSFIN